MAQKDYGIIGCINCTGMHPDETINIMEIMNRIHKPQKVVAHKLMALEKKRKLGLYNDKSCALCGRTYDKNGHLDESWELTAERVKISFDEAGVPGVTDHDIKKVVASCIKSWKILFKNRATITPRDAETMTFIGRLALIITHAQEAREKRNTLNQGKPLSKGLIV